MSAIKIYTKEKGMFAKGKESLLLKPLKVGNLTFKNRIMFGKRVACTINPSFELENEDTLQPAAVPIGKQDLTKVIKYMANRLEKSGVDVRLNTTVTKEMLENEFKGYEVIAGCGAKANVIGAFTGFKQWMTAGDILAGRAFPGRKIVIIGGGSVGCELADYLAPIVNDRFIRNRDITILEMAQEVMLTETGAGRSVVVQRLMDKGVRMECLAKVTEVTETEIKYEQSGAEYVISDADTLVFANGYHIESAVEDMLKEAGVAYHLIGDGCKVGNIKDAITQGYTVAKDLA